MRKGYRCQRADDRDQMTEDSEVGRRKKRRYEGKRVRILELGSWNAEGIEVGSRKAEVGNV